MTTDSTTGRGARGDSRPALARCTDLDPAAFASEVWGRRPLLTTADKLTGFADLFSLDAVDELVSRRGLRTPFLRVAKGGAVVPTARYTRSGGTGAQVADQVVDDRLLDLFVDGHTLVLQGLHRVWPALVDFAGQLVTDLGHPVQVNAYVTPSQSQGFSAHYDTHDVFVLQVAGEKRWRIHEPVLPSPLRDQAWTDHRSAVEQRATTEPVIDTVLRPGDSLYLPRGYLHAAEALGGVTCHLTVGVHPVTRHDLLTALVALVADDEGLRASLPLGVDLAEPADVQPDLDATVDALLSRVRSVTAADVSSALATSRLGGRRPAPLGPLAQAEALRTLTSESVLAVRRHLDHVLVTDDEGVVDGSVTLVLPGRRVELGAASAKAVRALLDGARLRVDELPGLEPVDALALARRLVREGVVVTDPAP
ncbi:MAG TPA: cupin domain-containing protein [Actinomycetes bacterium]|nr:cupin domain-containing protein [Actinomycetes bacterium]